MRQRKLKDLDEVMKRYSDLLIRDGMKYKGKWRENFGCNGKMFLEIGCGKGQFIISHGIACPNNLYLAIEGQESVIVRAAAKLEETNLNNVLLISEYVKDITDYFEDSELDGIYLNFSDPWPKGRHAKRRLTYRNFLESYKRIIKTDGFLEFKTDNDGLYEFTLEEIAECGLKIEEQTRDLHSTSFNSNNFPTEYEDRFSSKGKNINYVKIKIDK